LFRARPPEGVGMHFVLMKMFVSHARKRTNYFKHSNSNAAVKHAMQWSPSRYGNVLF